MKAYLDTYRQSPRKVRLLADLIRGKGVIEAKHALMFADKRAAPIVSKLLASAISNAKQNFAVEAEGLFVKEVTVNKGVTLKRSMPRARGSAFPINKRTSHISIVLGLAEEKKKTRKEMKKIRASKTAESLPEAKVKKVRKTKTTTK